MKNRKIIIPVLAVILTILLYASMNSNFKISRKYSHIDIQNGTTGDIVTIDDLEKADEFIHKINSMKFKKSSIEFPRMGYLYKITFYNEDSADFTIIVSGDKKFKNKLWVYQSNESIVKYLEHIIQKI